MATAVEAIKGQTSASAFVFTEPDDQSTERTQGALRVENGEADAMCIRKVTSSEAPAFERIVDYVADPETIETNRRLMSALGICIVVKKYLALHFKS